MSNLIISGGLSSVRVLGKSVEPVAMVEPASTFTGVTVSDNGGKVRLTGAGSHGITAAISVTPGDINIYISGGDGWTAGMHRITGIDTDTTGTVIDLDTDYDAGMGSPMVVLENTEVTLAAINVPPLQPDSMIRVDYSFSSTDSSSSAKGIRCKLNTTNFASYSTTTSPTHRKVVVIHNRGTTSSQISGWPSGVSTSSEGNTSSSLTYGSVDTSVPTLIKLAVLPSLANIVQRLNRYSVELI